MSIKDLPSPNAPNYLLRVRETIHTMLGKTGLEADRLLSLRDLIRSGLIQTGPGGSLLPGPGVVPEPEEPDLTPPPIPGNLTATPAISHILIEVPPATYTQGHGHLRTRVYGAILENPGDPLPVFDDAVEVGQFDGTVWAMPSNPATTWHLWAKWETRDGVLSPSPAGGTNGVAATTGQDVSSLLDALTGQISGDQLAQDLATPIGLIPSIDSTAALALSRANQSLSSVDALQAEVAAIAGTAEYDAGETYIDGNIVKYQGGLYRAVTTTTGNLPTNANYWEKIGDYASLGDAVAAHAVQLSDHETRITSNASGLAAEISARQALATQVSSNTAAISAEQTARANADSALSSTINSVSAVANAKNKTYYQTTAPASGMTAGDLWFDSDDGNKAYRYSGSAWVPTDDTRIAANAAAITTEQTARANGDSALASQITTLSSTVNGNTAAIQTEATTRASETGELFAKYTVKVDVAGHVSGYGLASTANNGAVVSQFGIRADQFFIAPPAFSSALDPSSAWGPRDANAVAFNGRFVAGGASGYVATSEDGAVWSVQLGLANTAWGSAAVRAMTSGASVLLAGGDAGRMATSPDGIAWTYQDGLRATTWGTTANCLSIAWNGAVFVALGQSGRAATSPDGVTWTYRSGLSATTWGTTTSGNAVLWSGSVFVAGGDAGRVATSPDGVTWTYRGGLRTTTWGTAAAVTALAWNGSVFLAVGASGRAATSPDGSTWTYRSGLSTTTWGTATANAATWDGSKFIVVGDSGRVATSPDGVTWTYQGQLSGTAWSTGSVRGIAQGSSRLVLVGYNGNAAYSMDGLTWTVGGLSTATPNLVYKGMVWVDTSVTPNVTRYYTGSAWSTIPQALPFVVQASPTTINGQVVPAGVYMDAAYIRDGTITSAKIANLAVDDAKIANLSVSKLTAGSLDVGQYAQSAGYVAGSSGWRINGDGNAEFSNAIVRGTVYATDGEFTGTVRGATIVGSTITTADSGQRIKMDADGILFLTGASSGKYGSFKYGAKKYGDGVLVYFNNAVKRVPFYVNSEQNVADIHLYNRAANPPPGEPGDIICVNSRLKTWDGISGRWRTLAFSD